jgi:hypothetical protein
LSAIDIDFNYIAAFWAHHELPNYLPTAHPSPDWALAFYRLGELYEIANGALVSALPLTENSAVAWKPDSSSFATEIETSSSHQLVLFDRRGHVVETIFDIPEDHHVMLRNRYWSHDGRYLAFAEHEAGPYFDPYGHYINFYIADLTEQVVFDTCGGVNPGAWSPSNTQFAFSGLSGDTGYVMVLDLESWALHPVAIHSGVVIGWRED